MSTAITFTAPRIVPMNTEPTPSRPVAGSTDAATEVTPAKSAPSAALPSQPSVREETERDSSGLTVFRTVDLDTGSLVAQFPTEAYLRLANAMKDVGRADTGIETPSERTV